jgi:hypothetical protein
MIHVSKEGIDIRVEVQDFAYHVELRGRLTAAGEADEACPVTVLGGVLGDLLRAGRRQFEIDISGLRDIDSFGVKLLRGLHRQADCLLIIPGEGMKLEPLLVVEMLIGLEWSTPAAA